MNEVVFLRLWWLVALLLQAMLLVVIGAVVDTTASSEADEPVCVEGGTATNAATDLLCRSVANDSITVRQLGIDVLTQAIGGRRPDAWKEVRLARILASIGANGWGDVNRLQLHFDEEPRQLSIISKRFVPSFDAGVTTLGSMNAVEESRHLEGFLVEVAAYTNLSALLLKSGLAAPALLHSTEARLGQPCTLLLEDLSKRFPRGSDGDISRQMGPREVEGALQWLAGFHALFWEKPAPQERGLWRRGTYWTLDELGRLELVAVQDSYANRYISNAEWLRLRNAAPAIDSRLVGLRASDNTVGEAAVSKLYRTLVHGDAKPANIMCEEPRQGQKVDCAFFDFAWAGEGYGMYDVMYVLWGEWTQESVDKLLDLYHTELTERLPPIAARAYTPFVMRQHFELCVLDFCRWWVGFRKGSHFWAMPWAVAILRSVLNRLDGGLLLSESEYAIAVDREFPLLSEAQIEDL